MNSLNELNILAESIKNTEVAIGATSFDTVVKYCVNKHNEAFDIIKSVIGFIEGNMEIFENGKGGWSFRNKEYHTNFNIGSSNPYNCVIRDKHHEEYNKDSRIYWVDEGIFFHIVCGKVVYVSPVRKPKPHGSDKMNWNDSTDFRQFNYFKRYNEKGNYPTSFLGIEWFDKIFPEDFNEFQAFEVKKRVDEDLALANETMDALIRSIKAIGESVNARLNRNAKLIEQTSSTKTTKYTIEITKIEE